MGYTPPSLSGAQMLDALTTDSVKLTSHKWQYIASDDILKSSDAEETTTSDTYVKLKEFVIPTGVGLSLFRFTFDLKGEGVGNGLAKLYQNATPSGTEHSCSGSYAAKTEDFGNNIKVGDVIGLYVKRDGSATAGVQNFKIKGIYSSLKQLSSLDEPSW